MGFDEAKYWHIVTSYLPANNVSVLTASEGFEIVHVLVRRGDLWYKKNEIIPMHYSPVYWKPL